MRGVSLLVIHLPTDYHQPNPTQTDTLIVASQGVLSSGSTTNKPLIDQLRSSFKSQLNTSVHGLIRDYQTQLKRISTEFKALSKKCDAYGKTEAGLNKANVKKTKAEQAGAPENKQHKLVATLQTKTTAYEVWVSVLLVSSREC